ncbi:MAG: NADP-dependent oxidoreductase [Myxococcota bacterium]|nr:NADP-dependent oxidoreductase [Myxococcota bacterium]
MTSNRRIMLSRRPCGEIKAEDFSHVVEPLQPLRAGHARLRNCYLSIDPAIRGWMSAGASYISPVALGAVMRSAALSEVIAVNGHPRLTVGQVVVGLSGWEDYSDVGADFVGRVVPVEHDLPITTALSVLGGNGLTAWLGVHEIGQAQPGDTVLVSAAAGGVGSIAGQLARLAGCRVVGLAGTDEKVAWLTGSLGFHGGINYKSARAGAGIYTAIREACPRGVDVFFDSVGGDILDAALGTIRVGARVVLCGAISQINAATLPPGPANYIRLLTKRARMQGFVTLDYADRWEEISAKLAAHVRSGALRHREHIVEGLPQAPEALIGILRGENLGKMMVRVGP